MARTKTKPENGNGSTLGFEAKLWLAADKLRNNLDAAEYKHVVLGLIFLKYTSDAFEEQHAMEIQCRKSRVSPSFLPEKMRKDEPTPDYARHRITPDNQDSMRFEKLVPQLTTGYQLGWPEKTLHAFYATQRAHNRSNDGALKDQGKVCGKLVCELSADPGDWVQGA